MVIGLARQNVYQARPMVSPDTHFVLASPIIIYSSASYLVLFMYIVASHLPWGSVVTVAGGRKNGGLQARGPKHPQSREQLVQTALPNHADLSPYPLSQ